MCKDTLIPAGKTGFEGLRIEQQEDGTTLISGYLRIRQRSMGCSYSSSVSDLYCSRLIRARCREASRQQNAREEETYLRLREAEPARTPVGLAHGKHHRSSERK